MSMIRIVLEYIGVYNCWGPLILGNYHVDFVYPSAVIFRYTNVM